jgi:hypothetical protein
MPHRRSMLVRARIEAVATSAKACNPGVLRAYFSLSGGQKKNN